MGREARDSLRRVKIGGMGIRNRRPEARMSNLGIFLS
jgi:hypothetical protein